VSLKDKAITVSDSGPGIAGEDLPRLFERFYRGKSAGSDSAGIGLALSKSIIMNHGGTVEAGNLPEGGAVFTVRFYKQAKVPSSANTI
jgi:signal transduction histidine kinase